MVYGDYEAEWKYRTSLLIGRDLCYIAISDLLYISFLLSSTGASEPHSMFAVLVIYAPSDDS
jgi:hypothetical protein